MSASKFVLLKPDSTLLSTGYNVEFGGGAANPSTHHAALADELPSATKVTGVPWTRIFDVSSVLGGDYRCTFDSYTLETTEPVERCRRVRWEAVADMRAARFRVGLGNGATTAEPLGRGEFRPLPNGVGKVQGIVGPWATKAQDSGGAATQEWTQANLNDLRARFTPIAAHFLGTAYFYKLRIKLDIAQRAEPFFLTPFVDEVFPTGTPTLKWDEGSSDAQKKVELKIFKADVAEDDSFDINTSVNSVYVFKGTTTSLQHRVANKPNGGTFLEHGQRYYAFVKVATDFNGQDWWSLWSEGIAFKINAKPTVTVLGPLSPVIDTAKPIITWDFDDEEGDLQSGARVIVIEKHTLTWPGFVDPEEESLNGFAIYDSGLISTEAADLELPVALNNNKNYRAYVKVRQRVPSVLDSDYAYIQFDTAFAGPLTPSLDAFIGTETAIDLTVIPSLSNLLSADTSSIETTVGAWTAGTDTAQSRVNTQALHGSWSLQIQKTVGAGTATMFSDQLANACTPVAPGQEISAMVWMKAGTTGRSFRVDIESIDGTNSVIDTQIGTTQSDTTTGWTKAFCNLPSVVATVVKVRLKVSIFSAGVGENHFLDQAMIFSGSGSNLIPWDLGGGTLGLTVNPNGVARTKIDNWLTRNQSSLETDLTGWAAWTSDTTIARSNTLAVDGSWSLRLTRTTTTGQASAAITAPFPIGPAGNVGVIPGREGQEWTFLGKVRAGTVARSCFVNFVFYDVEGNALPNLPYLDENAVTDSTSVWTDFKLRATAPTDTAYVRVTVNTNNVVAGEFHYWDRMSVHNGDTSTWSLGDGMRFALTDHSLRITTAQLDWLPEEEVVLCDLWDYEFDANCFSRLVLQTDGKIRYEWSIDGTEGLRKTATSTAAMSVVAAGVKRTIRVDFDNDNGASGQNVSFFEGPDKLNASTAIGTNPVTVSTVNAPYQGYANISIPGGQGFDAGGFQGYAYDLTLYGDLVQSNDLAEVDFQYPGVVEFRDNALSGIPHGALWELPEDEATGDHAEMEMKEEPNPDFFVIERSRDEGVTWEIFRYGLGLLSDRIPKSFEPVTIRDEEVPLNKVVQYRANAGYTGLGYDASSGWSAVASETVLGKYVTLKCTGDPSLKGHFPVAEDWLEFRHTRNRTIFQPVGRRNPVVVRGSGHADAFSITFTLLGSDQLDLLHNILDHDAMIFVQTPKGSWWVEVATDVSFRAHLWDTLTDEEDVYQLEVPFQEVDRLGELSVASL